jgi:hypothetical protein
VFAKNKPHHGMNTDNTDKTSKIIESVQISVIHVISGKILAFWAKTFVPYVLCGSVLLLLLRSSTLGHWLLRRDLMLQRRR